MLPVCCNAPCNTRDYGVMSRVRHLSVLLPLVMLYVKHVRVLLHLVMPLVRCTHLRST